MRKKLLIGLGALIVLLVAAAFIIPAFVPVDVYKAQIEERVRAATGREFATYVCDAFDWLAAEGEHWPRMLSVGLHLRMIGRAGRIGALDSILRHLHASGIAWVTTREAIARHWIGACPAAR